MKWAVMDLTGTYPEKLGYGLSMPSTGAVPLGDAAELFAIARSMLVAGDWVARPSSPDAVLVAGVIALNACPNGAFATVSDVQTGDLLATVQELAGTIVITLPDPGIYRVEVDFGRPYLPTISFVTVP